MKLRLVFLFLTTLLLQASYSYADMNCGGLEPFWSLKIGPKKVFYSDNEVSKATLKITSVKEAAGFKPGFVSVYDMDGNGHFTAIIRKQKCSDGMSDDLYPYEITLIAPKIVYSGCCR